MFQTDEMEDLYAFHYGIDKETQTDISGHRVHLRHSVVSASPTTRGTNGLIKPPTTNERHQCNASSVRSLLQLRRQPTGHGAVVVSKGAEASVGVAATREGIVNSKVCLMRTIGLCHLPNPFSFRYHRDSSSTSTKVHVDRALTPAVPGSTASTATKARVGQIPTPAVLSSTLCAATAVAVTSGVNVLHAQASAGRVAEWDTGAPSAATLNVNNKPDVARAAGKRSVMSVGLGVTLPGANCVFLTLLTLLRM